MNIFIIEYKSTIPDEKGFEVVATQSNSIEEEQRGLNNDDVVIAMIPIDFNSPASRALAAILELDADNTSHWGNNENEPCSIIENLMLQIFMAGRNSVLGNHWASMGEYLRNYISQVSDARLDELYKILYGKEFSKERSHPLSTRNADLELCNNIIRCVSIELIERREGRIKSVA